MKKTKEARLKPACSSALFSFIGLNSHHLIPRHLGAASASSIQCKFGLLSIILMWLETDSTKHRVCYWLDLSLLLDCNINVLRDPLQRISWCASPERSYMLDTDPHYQCNKQCKCNSADKLHQSPGNGVEVEAFPHRGPCRRGHLFREKTWYCSCKWYSAHQEGKELEKMDPLQLRLSLCLTVGFPSFPLPLREGLEYHMVPKSWHCQNWVDPPTT